MCEHKYKGSRVKVKLLTASKISIIVLCTVLCISYIFSNEELAETEGLQNENLNTASIERGQNLVAVGNCAGCHTSDSDQPYAGGYPFKTPFGTIYSTNITPDRETGIGGWSYAAFRRAMTEGVDRKGEHLYPVFPYDHFSKMKDSDINDIYNYVMALEPIIKEKTDNDLFFPFNLRKPLLVWKFMFLDSSTFKEDASLTKNQNRGAYLVKGLAHCSACHSPRNSFGAIKNGNFLQGAVIDGWYAPPIGTNSASPVPWTKGHYFDYLYNGWSEFHGIASGPMTSVVDQLFDANEEDIDSISDFLVTLGTNSSNSEAVDSILVTQRNDLAKDIKSVDALRIDNPSYLIGQNIFFQNCKKCHYKKLSDDKSFSLAFSTIINLPNPMNFINIIKGGIHPPIAQSMRKMPNFNKKITDEDLIHLAAYVRKNFTKKPYWEDIKEYLDLPMD